MKKIKTFESFFDNTTTTKTSKDKILINDIEQMIRDMASTFQDINSSNVEVNVDDNIIELSVNYHADITNSITAHWDVNTTKATISITISEDGKTLEHEELQIDVGSVKTLIQELDKGVKKAFEIEKRFLK
ncbi:MAG: hypothetical protein ACC656_09600 [Candidatus Heimdallarchaeota archaeon]